MLFALHVSSRGLGVMNKDSPVVNEVIHLELPIASIPYGEFVPKPLTPKPKPGTLIVSAFLGLLSPQKGC